MYKGLVDRWAPLGESLRFGRVFNYYYFFGFCFCFFLIMLGGGRFIKGRISHLFLCVCFWGRGYSDGFCLKFAFCDAIERALNANLIF